MIKVFNNLQEMKRYYDEETDTYIFKENNEYIISEENGMRLISDYTFRSSKDTKDTKDPKESNTISHNVVYLNVLTKRFVSKVISSAIKSSSSK